MPDRVQTRRQFARLSTPTARGRSGPLRIVYVESTADDDGVAAAYAISRKVGNAVARNRIRRRLRSILDECGSSIKPGTYLIKCAIETGNLSYDELRRHLHGAIKNARLLR